MRTSSNGGEPPAPAAGRVTPATASPRADGSVSISDPQRSQSGTGIGLGVLSRTHSGELGSAAPRGGMAGVPRPGAVDTTPRQQQQQQQATSSWQFASAPNNSRAATRVRLTTPKALTHPGESQAAVKAAKMHALICDDSKVLNASLAWSCPSPHARRSPTQISRRILTRMLEALGCSVTQVSTGADVSVTRVCVQGLPIVASLCC